MNAFIIRSKDLDQQMSGLHYGKRESLYLGLSCLKPIDKAMQCYKDIGTFVNYRYIPPRESLQMQQTEHC